ncbi:TPA: NADH-flavin reductase, partial [Bacillus cereus]|nr:NADH-flavin reductase [Bacillus cereus]
MGNTNKIAILGANGKAGKFLVNEALEKGYQVKI